MPKNEKAAMSPKGKIDSLRNALSRLKQDLTLKLDVKKETDEAVLKLSQELEIVRDTYTSLVEKCKVLEDISKNNMNSLIKEKTFELTERDKIIESKYRDTYEIYEKENALKNKFIEVERELKLKHKDNIRNLSIEEERLKSAENEYNESLKRHMELIDEIKKITANKANEKLTEGRVRDIFHVK